MKRKHRGDSGFTDLYCAGKVLKDDIRCEVCGTLDELSAFLGLARSTSRSKKIQTVIEHIQKDLFVIGTEIATNKEKIPHLKERIDKGHIDSLESIIDSFGKNYPQSFVLFGREVSSSLLNVARTIARRLERRLVTLKRKRMLINDNIIVYTNRLSDLIFVLSVYAQRGGKAWRG